MIGVERAPQDRMVDEVITQIALCRTQVSRLLAARGVENFGHIALRRKTAGRPDTLRRRLHRTKRSAPRVQRISSFPCTSAAFSGVAGSIS